MSVRQKTAGLLFETAVRRKEEETIPMAKKDSNNKSFILRIDADTMDAIEKWAADEFRSTNGQLQWIINEALRKSGRLKKRKTANGDGGKETSDDV